MNPLKKESFIFKHSFFKMFSYLHTQKHVFQTTHTKIFEYIDHSELSPLRLVYDKQKKNNWPGNV